MKFQRVISFILALSIIFSLGISAFAEDLFARYAAEYQAALAQARAQAEETQREYERMLRDLFNLEEAYKHYIRLSSDLERQTYLNSLPAEHHALLQEYIDQKALETTAEEAYHTAVNDALNDLGEEDLEQFESIYQVYIDCYETYGKYADLSALNPLEQELVRNYVDRKKAPAEEQPATTETAEESDAEDVAEEKPEEAEQPKDDETTIPEDTIISSEEGKQIIPETEEKETDPEETSSPEGEEADPDEETEEDPPEEKGFLGGFMDFLFRGKSPAKENQEKQKTLTEEEESSDEEDEEKEEEEDSPKESEDDEGEEEKPVTLKKGNTLLASPSSNDEAQIPAATYSIAVGVPLAVTVSNLDGWTYGCRIEVYKGAYSIASFPTYLTYRELNSNGTVTFSDMVFEDGQYSVFVGVYINGEHNSWVSEDGWQNITISGNKVTSVNSAPTPVVYNSQATFTCPSSITVGQPLTVTVSNLDSWAKGCEVAVWKGNYISSDFVSRQELDTNGTVTFSETLFEEGDYSVSVFVYIDEAHTASTNAASGDYGYQNFTVSGSRVAAPTITTTKNTYSLDENFYFSIKLAKKGAEKIEWQTVLTQTDGSSNYFGSDVITDIPANGIVSNITTRSPHIGTVTISATAYYNGVASETGTKTITIKNQDASVLKFTKPTTNKVYDNEDLVIAWTSVTNADMYTLQIKQRNNYLTGGGTYYNNNPVTVPKNEITAGTPIEISVVAQYSDGKTLTYSDGSPVQAVMTLNVLSSAPNEIPDFEVSVPSIVPFGSPVTVTWTAPVWAENPNWSPSEYVIYWMRVTPEGIEDLYQPVSVKKGKPLTATLPGDYTLMQTDNDSSKCYQVSVYAVGEKSADNNPPPQKASDGVFNVSSPFDGKPKLISLDGTPLAYGKYKITAVTDSRVEKVTAVNNNSDNKAEIVGGLQLEKQDGNKKYWTSVEYTAGDYVGPRIWTLTAYIGEKVVGTANTEKIDINAITLNLTASPTSAKVGEKVKFTVSCNRPSGTVTVYAKDDYTGNEPVIFDEPINLAADNRTIERAFSTAGTRKIFAKLTDANTGAELKEVHIQIEISEKTSPLESITISAPSKVESGKTFKAIAIRNPSDASSETIYWGIEDCSVVTIFPGGHDFGGPLEDLEPKSDEITLIGIYGKTKIYAYTKDASGNKKHLAEKTIEVVHSPDESSKTVSIIPVSNDTENGNGNNKAMSSIDNNSTQNTDDEKINSKIANLKNIDKDKYEYLAALNKCRSAGVNPMDQNNELGNNFLILFEKHLEKAKLNAGQRQQIINVIKDADDTYRDIFLYSLLDYTMVCNKSGEGINQFDGKTNTLTMYKISNQDFDDTFFHECGHAAQMHTWNWSLSNKGGINPYEKIAASSPFFAKESEVNESLYQDVKDYIAGIFREKKFSTYYLVLGVQSSIYNEIDRELLSDEQLIKYYEMLNHLDAILKDIEINAEKDNDCKFKKYDYKDYVNHYNSAMEIYQSLTGYSFPVSYDGDMPDNVMETIISAFQYAYVDARDLETNNLLNKNHLWEGFKTSFNLTVQHEIEAVDIKIENNKQASMISDVFSGVSNKKIRGLWGHQNKYYWYDKGRNSTNSQLLEAWAEFYSAQIRKDQENIEYNREFFPEATKDLESLAEEIRSYYVFLYYNGE